ncbi:MAG TPA: hypothetical protein LFW20_01085 [Rickettsia endosymbiont of Omalisus fontisbellaquei]|nr:hypothetical protein [Rickettsia endosymbiont of Omalisus fontisbellaquei]
MRMCKLQNDTNISKELVDKIMFKVSLLLNERMSDTVLSVRALGKKAHDSSYEMDEPYKEVLKRVSLLDKNGEITPEVQDVIQSAISFDGCIGEAYMVGNPIKEILDYYVDPLGDSNI